MHFVWLCCSAHASSISARDQADIDRSHDGGKWLCPPRTQGSCPDCLYPYDYFGIIVWNAYIQGVSHSSKIYAQARQVSRCGLGVSFSPNRNFITSLPQGLRKGMPWAQRRKEESISATNMRPLFPMIFYHRRSDLLEKCTISVNGACILNPDTTSCRWRKFLLKS